MTAKKGARPKAPTAQDKRVAQLENEVKLLAWLHAELVYSTKVAFAKLVMQMNPQIMDTIAARMVQAQTKKGAMP